MKPLVTTIIPPILTKKGKLTSFVWNYMNPNVKALYIIKGTNLPIGKTCGNNALTFGNYLLRE